MAANSHFILLVFGVSASLLFGSDQIDGAKFASDLEQKYGPPVPRATYIDHSGIEMIVDFAANGHVCMIQLPPVGPSKDPAEPGLKTTRAIDDLALELAPLSLRGKQLTTIVNQAGAVSQSTVKYENVDISETLLGGKRTGVAIMFRNEKCQERSVH